MIMFDLQELQHTHKTLEAHVAILNFYFFLLLKETYNAYIQVHDYIFPFIIE